MKKFIVIALTLALPFMSIAQSTIERSVPSFYKIKAGDKVNLHLLEGDQPEVRLEIAGVEPYRVIHEVIGGELHIYLDEAKLFDYKSIYLGASVNAYVTYQDLEKITKKGEGVVTCHDVIYTRHMSIVTYGENDIVLEGLVAKNLVVKAYGDNFVQIRSGAVDDQKLKLYGDNVVDVAALEGKNGKVSTYGTSEVEVATEDRIRYNVYGEGKIKFAGTPQVSQGVVIGEKALYQKIEEK